MQVFANGINDIRSDCSDSFSLVRTQLVNLNHHMTKELQSVNSELEKVTATLSSQNTILTDRLEKIKTTLSSHTDRLEKVETTLSSHTDRLEKVVTTLSSHTDRLKKVETEDGNLARSKVLQGSIKELSDNVTRYTRAMEALGKAQNVPIYQEPNDRNQNADPEVVFTHERQDCVQN